MGLAAAATHASQLRLERVEMLLLTFKTWTLNMWNVEHRRSCQSVNKTHDMSLQRDRMRIQSGCLLHSHGKIHHFIAR